MDGGFGFAPDLASAETKTSLAWSTPTITLATSGTTMCVVSKGRNQAGKGKIRQPPVVVVEPALNRRRGGRCLFQLSALFKIPMLSTVRLKMFGPGAFLLNADTDPTTIDAIQGNEGTNY